MNEYIPGDNGTLGCHLPFVVVVVVGMSVDDGNGIATSLTSSSSSSNEADAASANADDSNYLINPFAIIYITNIRYSLTHSITDNNDVIDKNDRGSMDNAYIIGCNSRRR
jgi:hypothetical protein